MEEDKEEILSFRMQTFRCCHGDSRQLRKVDVDITTSSPLCTYILPSTLAVEELTRVPLVGLKPKLYSAIIVIDLSQIQSHIHSFSHTHTQLAAAFEYSSPPV